MLDIAIKASEKARDDHAASKLAEEKSKEEEVNSARAAEDSKKVSASESKLRKCVPNSSILAG